MKNYKVTFLFLILAELLSIFAWSLPVFNLICFFVILVLTLVLSIKKLQYGIFIAFAELIIGSQGYLFSLTLNGGETLVSIRMGIFAMVMLALVVSILRCSQEPCHSHSISLRMTINTDGLKEYWRKIKQFKFFKYYIYLAIVLIYGFAWGIIRGNDFGNVFLDFNNWLFFLYLLPLLDIADSKNFWKNFSQIILAALSWLIIKTLILLYIFSHKFIWALPEVYKWIRDTRVGEITMMSNNFYRIFLQSQIYCLIAFFMLLPFLNKIQNIKYQPDMFRKAIRAAKKQKISNFQFPISKQFLHLKFQILLISCLTVIIISFSRSFWMGLVGCFIVYCLLFIVYYRANFKQFLKQALIVLFAGIISIGIIFVIINLPPKIIGENFASLISKRTTQIEAAGSSRINMLKPLLRSIAKHPIIGSGFGTAVSYRSVDPRILTTTAGASGEYTAYAFEWSYLDLLLKIGLFGLFIYLLLIFKILQAIWQQVKNFKSQIYNFFTRHRLAAQSLTGGQINLKSQIPNFDLTPKNSISNNKNNYKLQVTSYKLQLGLFLALIALLIVNIFTPYLNHPLGIGFVILISIFVSQQHNNE